MESYQEMVEKKIKHINDDIQQLDYFKNKAAKEERISEVFANSLIKLSDKLRQTKLESRVVIERTKEQQQQNREEVMLSLMRQRFIIVVRIGLSKKMHDCYIIKNFSA